MKPVFLTMMVAGGVAVGAAADHWAGRNWSAASGADGTLCSCAEGSKLPVAQIAPAPELAESAQCALAAGGPLAAGGALTVDNAGAAMAGGSYPGVVGARPAALANSAMPSPRAAAPRADCPQSVVAAPVAQPSSDVTLARDPEPRAIIKPLNDTERSSIPMLAIGGVLSLIGLGFALRRKPGEKKGVKRAAALAGLYGAAKAQPLDPRGELPLVDFAEPAIGGSESLEFSPVANEHAEPRTYTPHEARLTPGWRKPGGGRNKSRRWLAYLLLATGSVAAIAASVTRMPFSDRGETVSHVVAKHAHTVLATAGDDPDAKVAHNGHADTPITWIGGRTPEFAGTSTPHARGIGPNLGADSGSVADRDRGRLAELDPTGDVKQGLHEFDANGGSDKSIADPSRGYEIGTLDPTKHSGGGGGGGSGGITASGANSSGGTDTASSGGSGSTDTSGGTSGGASSSGGSSGGTDGTGTSTGGASSNSGSSGGATSGGTSSGGATSSGASSGGGGGGHPGDLIGTDPGSSGGAIDVPEPDTIGLLALGIVGLAIGRSRLLRRRLARNIEHADDAGEDLAEPAAVPAD